MVRQRRGKILTAADIALWREVARSVKPLPGRPPLQPEPAITASDDKRRARHKPIMSAGTGL